MKNKSLRILLFSIAAAVTLWSCSEDLIVSSGDEEDPQAAEDSIQQRQIDDELIDSYIAENGYNDVFTTDLGVRYTIANQGGGPAPELNEIVTVSFIGKYINDTIFDTNIQAVADTVTLNKNNGVYQPFVFNYTADGGVIGFSGVYSYLNVLPQLRIAIGRSLGLMNEGATAVIMMPSGAALGRFGIESGDFVILPNQILIFEIFLIKVRKN